MKSQLIIINCILLVMLVFMIPLCSLTLLAEVIGYDTKCGVCGYDNVQWINEDHVNYCEKCGAVGNAYEIIAGTEQETSNSNQVDRPTSEVTDDEEIPVEVVVGTAAAVVVVATAMANAKKAKKKKTGRTPNKKSTVAAPKLSQAKSQKQSEKAEAEKPAGYIMQLTEDNIMITEGKEAIIGVRVLQVNDKGQTTVAPNAVISIQAQKDTSLYLTPNTGMGVLNIKITQNGSIQQDRKEMVRIGANVPGKTIEAMLAVTLKTSLRMVFFD